ncbi:hypothetical protein [Aquiflexum lacus]|uniref:hypothetical protein n=1 Tax=Aquiflexum lacus TaxID=2483805 RepID=UPI001895B15D|nr:hypothetical protein [Aquiflexum lacus]
MKKFWSKYFPAELRLLSFWFFLALLFFVVTPILSFGIWYLTPSSPFGVLLVNKTVPNQAYQEHQSVHWLLNHFKYTKLNGGFYDKSKDYFGFFPGNTLEESSINDLSSLSSSEIDNLLNKNELIYYADTYGVYENDFNGPILESPSKKIYGGMDQSDMKLLKAAFAKEVDIIAEFNTIASPTGKAVRMEFENLAEIKWTGWITRYFDELDTLLNNDLPRWLIKGYVNQHDGVWGLAGPGMVFVHENGSLEILQFGKDFLNNVPNIISTSKNQKKYEIPEIVKYPYWIDVILVSRDFEVISYYDLLPTEEGLDKLREMGVPRYFPAAVVKENGQGKFYYFCGDFADNPVSGSSYKFFGISKLWRMFLQAEDYSQRNSFFWNYYYPLMKNILKDSEARQKHD